MMRTRFQCDICRRPDRILLGHANRHDFGMGPTTGLGPALTDDTIPLDNHTANTGVIGALAHAPATNSQGRGHPALVSLVGHYCPLSSSS